MKHIPLYILLRFLFSTGLCTGCTSGKLVYKLEGIPSRQIVEKTLQEESGKIFTREIDGVSMVEPSGGTFRFVKLVL
jgi:hypothetical protein